MRFGMFGVSVGHVTPNTGAAFYSFLEKPCVSTNSHAFYETTLFQLGSVLPDSSAVYVRHWCVMFECDGPSLMFVCAFYML